MMIVIQCEGWRLGVVTNVSRGEMVIPTAILKKAVIGYYGRFQIGNEINNR